MPRQVHRIVQYAQNLDHFTCRTFGNPEDDEVPTVPAASTNVQRRDAETDVVSPSCA
ncbi:MAG TPA: hypothetical protein VIR38_09015 [Thalassobaculum sp.]